MASKPTHPQTTQDILSARTDTLQMTPASVASQLVGTAQSFAVTVKDASGALLANVPVTLSIAGGHVQGGGGGNERFGSGDGGVHGDTGAGVGGDGVFECGRGADVTITLQAGAEFGR